MSRSYRFYQVDVFTREPLRGNPLAVFPEASGLSDDEMQAIAREMNLSETTFVLPPESPDAHYRNRIFTPASELPFAGHPTLGTAHLLVEQGFVELEAGQGTLRQQTGAGIQAIDVEPADDGYAFTMTQPTPSFAPGPEAKELADALGIDAADILGQPATVSVGVAWHVAELRSLDLLQSMAPDMGKLAELERRTGPGTTVFCEGAADPSCAVRVRSFAPGQGVPEDPVCGSGNGCVGAYRARRDGSAHRYRAEQGIEVGREGRAEVEVEPLPQGELRVRVGGRAVTIVEAELRLS